jgi:hypothetical protein
VKNTTIRIERNLSLNHATFLTPLNTLISMPSEMVSATTRKNIVLPTAMEAHGTIPDPLTIHCFEELLTIISDFRCGRARGRAWIWLVGAASLATNEAGGGSASNVGSRVLSLVEEIRMGSTAERSKISVSVRTLSSSSSQATCTVATPR